MCQLVDTYFGQLRFKSPFLSLAHYSCSPLSQWQLWKDKEKVFGLAAQTAQKQKSRTTKSPLMQDWVFRLGSTGRLSSSHFITYLLICKSVSILKIGLKKNNRKMKRAKSLNIQVLYFLEIVNVLRISFQSSCVMRLGWKPRRFLAFSIEKLWLTLICKKNKNGWRRNDEIKM